MREVAGDCAALRSGESFGRGGLGADGRLVAQLFNGGAEAGGEFVGLANGHAGSVDGIADGESEPAGVEVARVNGQ